MIANDEEGIPPSDEECWPREVVIRPSVKKAIELLGSEYKGDPEGDDALLWKIGYEMSETITIASWKDFEKNYRGYDLGDPYMRQEHEEFLTSKNV